MKVALLGATGYIGSALLKERSTRSKQNEDNQPGYMDLVANQFGPVNRKVNAMIQHALDPNGIIGPGKSGIV